MKRSGFADLPLHGGRVPPWLAARMETLGTAITESIVHHYGTAAFLSRLSDPFWFQSLGCVMGMDWHSSGITTSVLGALKRGLKARAHELGLYLGLWLFAPLKSLQHARKHSYAPDVAMAGGGVMETV